MLIVEHDTKSFMVMDQQSMKKMLEQINQVMSQTAGQFEGLLGNLPVAQRAMIQQKMKNNLPTRQAPQQSRAVARRLNNM